MFLSSNNLARKEHSTTLSHCYHFLRACWNKHLTHLKDELFVLIKSFICFLLQEAKSHREKELKTAEEEVKKSKKKAEESTKNMKAKQQVIAKLC